MTNIIDMALAPVAPPKREAVQLKVFRDEQEEAFESFWTSEEALPLREPVEARLHDYERVMLRNLAFSLWMQGQIWRTKQLTGEALSFLPVDKRDLLS